jgi:hypothetical protein
MLYEELFDYMKRLGLPVPLLSTKEEQDKIEIFANTIKQDCGMPLPEVVEQIEKNKAQNAEMEKSLHEGIKKTWGL